MTSLKKYHVKFYFNMNYLFYCLGHYFYIETSRPRTQGQKAKLLSRTVSATSTVCISFYYHMYGNNIGALNVYLTKSGASNSVPAWTRKGNQQNKWTIGQLTMNPGQNQQVFSYFNCYKCSILCVFSLFILTQSHKVMSLVEKVQNTNIVKKKKNSQFL